MDNDFTWVGPYSHVSSDPSAPKRKRFVADFFTYPVQRRKIKRFSTRRAAVEWLYAKLTSYGEPTE